MTFIAILVAIAAGGSNPFQSGANAELNKQLGQSFWAIIVVYTSGLAGVILCQLFLRQHLPTGTRIAAVPVWAWFGGLISILPTFAGLTLAQRLGAGVFTGLTVTAGLATSILLDQFAVFGFRQHTASPARIGGCALMVVGLWIIART